MSCVETAVDNLSSLSAMNSTSTGDQELYEAMYHVLYGYGLPSICAFGFFGNVLNLVVLAGKREQRSLRSKERSANIGMIALAVADMSFCITAFPSTFLPQDMSFQHKGFFFYYGTYCAAVINIFIMTSTWITVTMATERYLAICHPLKSRNILTLGRTKTAIVVVYLCSGLINIPVFWRYTSVTRTCHNVTVYSLKPQVPYGDVHFDHAYRAIWAIVGNFIPLALLLVFNFGLMREIHKSYAMRKRMNGNAGVRIQRSQDVESSHRITITLVAIVVLFFILVAPSEILKHVAYLFGGDLSQNYTYMTIEIVTNVMQTINFSANFILYCFIHPSFRRIIREKCCPRYRMLSGEATDYYSERDERFSSVRMKSLRGDRHDRESVKCKFSNNMSTSNSPKSPKSMCNSANTSLMSFH